MSALVKNLKFIFLFVQILLVLNINCFSISYAFAYPSKTNSLKNTKALILNYSSLNVEYKNFLYFSKSFHSFVQDYLYKQELNTKGLEKQFNSAQNLYFQGRLALAKSHFTDIIKQQWNKDWTKKQKNWIYFSFLRLAQIAKEFKEKQFLINQAIAFAPYKKPNIKVFSPPFVKLYKKLYKQTQWSYISNYLKLQNYEKIIVNGRVFDIKPNIKISVSSFSLFRVSLLSNKSQVYSEITNYKLFSEKKLLQKALVTGDCDNFDNHSNYKYSIFFSKSCIKNTLLTAKTVKLKSKKINLFAKQSLSPIKQKKTKSKAKVNKKQWFLIVLGIVGAGIIASQFIKNPSNTKGFDD